MAYTRRRTTARRSTARPARRSGYTRSAPRTTSRRSASRGNRGGQTVRLVIEQASPSPVSRPSYLARLNPALVETGAAALRKAKL